jgi:hypothetical protein
VAVILLYKKKLNATGMKKILNGLLAASIVFTTVQCTAQDASKKPSPPASASAKIKSGATLSINYNAPSVKGRTIGVNLEPKKGEIWRTGANEATVFETSQAVKINGQELAAGKYALFTIMDEGEWTVIFNKVHKQWGAYDYKQSEDALRIKAKVTKGAAFTEKMTFTIAESGKVDLLWGDYNLTFTVD